MGSSLTSSLHPISISKYCIDILFTYITINKVIIPSNMPHIPAGTFFLFMPIQEHTPVNKNTAIAKIIGRLYLNKLNNPLSV